MIPALARIWFYVTDQIKSDLAKLSSGSLYWDTTSLDIGHVSIRKPSLSGGESQQLMLGKLCPLLLLLGEDLQLLLKIGLGLLDGGLAVLEGEGDELLGREWRPSDRFGPSDMELLLQVLHVLEEDSPDPHELGDQGEFTAEVVVLHMKIL